MCGGTYNPMVEKTLEAARRQPERSRYRSGHRRLLILTLIGAVLGSLLVVLTQSARRSGVSRQDGMPGSARYMRRSDWLSFGPPISERDKWNARSSKFRYGFNYPVLADGCEINMHGEGIADDSLKSIGLEELSGIRSVNLEGSRITDAGLGRLTHCRQLLALDLGGTQITDAGIEYLKECPRLRWLSLYGTRLSDAGVEHLETLSELQWLNLDATEVGDVGLAHLEGLSKLEVLHLRDKGVTRAGVARLQQALPNCNIIWRTPTQDQRKNPATPDQLR